MQPQQKEYKDSEDSEEAGLIETPSPPPRSSRFRRLGPMFLLSLSNVISLSALLLLIIRHDQTPCPPCVMNQRTSWTAPEIPVTKVLEAANIYTRPPDEDELKAWSHLMPVGRGLVMVNSSGLPPQPGLDPKLPRGASGWTGVAHQLHCLYSTKHAFYDLYYNRTGDKTTPLFGVSWQLEHLNHCWDYVRQTIMCNPDLTVEWRGAMEGTGWGYERQCKKWEPIYDWLEKHRITNDRGIMATGYESKPLDVSEIPGVWSNKDIENIDV